jgi:hypothetical protein
MVDSHPWKCIREYWFTLIDCCFHGTFSSYMFNKEEPVIHRGIKENVGR